MKFVLGRNDRPQMVIVKLADAAQCVIHALLFGVKLRLIVDVLPSAAAAVSGVRTGRHSAIGRGRDNLDHGAYAEAILVFYGTGENLIAGRGMRYHPHPSIDAAHSMRAVGQTMDL